MAIGPVVGRLLERLSEFQRNFLLTSVHLGHESDPYFDDRIGLLSLDVRHHLEHGGNGGDAGIERLELHSEDEE